MNPPTMALASTLSPTRNGELTAAYVDTLPGDIKVHVITDQDEIDVRAAALHAKLVPLGITDLTQEGTLVLSGETEITPGLRRGVVLTGHVDTIGPHRPRHRAGVLRLHELRSDGDEVGRSPRRWTPSTSSGRHGRRRGTCVAPGRQRHARERCHHRRAAPTSDASTRDGCW